MRETTYAYFHGGLLSQTCPRQERSGADLQTCHAVDEEEAIKIAKREIQSENPELNLSQFSIEVSELLHR